MKRIGAPYRADSGAAPDWALRCTVMFLFPK